MRARGYTLIELLITVAIIGIAAGLVTLSLRGNEARRLSEETDRLAALFRMAAAEARISGRALVWEADLSGYHFRPLVPDSSLPLREELSRERRWGVALERLQTRELLFAREPLREPAVIELATGSQVVRLALDAQGNLQLAECQGPGCAASR
jgi:general secretion pathway protein H